MTHSVVQADHLIETRLVRLSLVSATEPDLALDVEDTSGVTAAERAMFAAITALAARLHEYAQQAVVGEIALNTAVQVALDKIHQPRPAV